jgi:uncharacterized protein (DUF433 family)
MGSDLRELEKNVLELNPIEKASLLQVILRGLDFNFPGIDRDPAICGGDPCIAHTRIPVWILVKFRRLGMSEIDLLKNYPSLNANDLVNACSNVINLYSKQVLTQHDGVSHDLHEKPLHIFQLFPVNRLLMGLMVRYMPKIISEIQGIAEISSL